MADEFYESIRLLSYGLFVVCSKKNKKYNGLIVNTIFQITSKPQMIAVSICKDNLTHDYIMESGVFTASILDKDTPMKFIGRFGFRSGKIFDKFKDPLEYQKFITDVPIITEHTLGYLEAVVKQSVDCGTHTLFIAKVVGGKVLRAGEPLTYMYYQKVKKGKAPKNAPTYFFDMGK
ncbi:MAG: flavin reductase family protein [Asgard group archaeon]|nr:flavin reductase family protein [Asgard group archaeon]